MNTPNTFSVIIKQMPPFVVLKHLKGYRSTIYNHPPFWSHLHNPIEAQVVGSRSSYPLYSYLRLFSDQHRVFLGQKMCKYVNDLIAGRYKICGKTKAEFVFFHLKSNVSLTKNMTILQRSFTAPGFIQRQVSVIHFDHD